MRVLVANFVMKPDKNLEEGRGAKGWIAEATLSRCGELGDSSTVPFDRATFARVAERKSVGDDGIAKLHRHKAADSCNAWTARSERRDEVFGRDDRQSAMNQQAMV